VLHHSATVVQKGGFFTISNGYSRMEKDIFFRGSGLRFKVSSMDYSSHSMSLARLYTDIFGVMGETVVRWCERGGGGAKFRLAM